MSGKNRKSGGLLGADLQREARYILPGEKKKKWKEDWCLNKRRPLR